MTSNPDLPSNNQGPSPLVDHIATHNDVKTEVMRDVGRSSSVTSNQLSEAERQLRHAQEQINLTQRYPGRGR